MTKTLNGFILLILAFIVAPAARAQQSGANLPAWQVTSFDVSVNASGGDRAIAARATINARNVGGAAGRTLTLRLNPAAKIESATVSGQSATFNSGKDSAAQLQTAQITLPAPVPVGGSVTATLDYRLPVAENTGLAAVSPLGLQFLPLSQWYPSPNTPIAPRGADYAPVKLSFTGLPAGDAVVSSGKASGAVFEQPLSAQPFFLTGRWETVEGTGEARGVTAMLHPGATAEERKNAEGLVALAGAARAFYASMLGPAPDVPVRLVGVRRGAGFELGGTLLLNNAAFTRRKLDSVTATQVADAVARLWIGGAAGIEGEGAGALREGLPRFLAALFLEKQFGKPAADAEWMRMALLYAPVAARDASLSKLTPSFDTYFNSTTNKGALAWRILSDAVGREAFLGALRGQFSQGGGSQALTLAALRARLAQAGGDRASLLMASLFDLPTDTDLLVGLPVERAGAWVSNLRNTGSFDVEVAVQALTASGERLTTRARIPAKDFGEALFKTTSKIVRVEVDPEKFYPQTNFTNDVVPQGPGLVEAVEQARIQLGQQPARAESLAREVLARAPANEEARVVLARALLEQNRLDEAEREFGAAVAAPLPVPATLAWSDIGLGEIALKRNRPADAAKLFDSAARAEADYASTLAARAARIRAETAAGAPAVDEQIKTAVANLDTAIKTARRAEIEGQIVGGELTGFAKGLSGIPPELWQTRVLRTEQLDPNRIAADVVLSARVTGRSQEGPAVYVFARTPAGWKLAEIPIFEVR